MVIKQRHFLDFKVVFVVRLVGTSVCTMYDFVDHHEYALLDTSTEMDILTIIFVCLSKSFE